MSNNIRNVRGEYLKRNERGMYLGFCNSSRHRGIVLNETKCRNINCPHYFKLYFNERHLLAELREEERRDVICLEPKNLEGFIGEDGEVR